MKKTFASLMLLFLLASAAWSQVAHDPNDALYADIDRWAAKGYLRLLPPVRPYPQQLIDELLETVVRKGDAASVRKAEEYRAEFAPKARALHVGAVGTIRGEDADITLEGAPFVDGSVRMEDWLVFSYSFFVYGATRKPGDQIEVPGVYSPYADMVKDNAKVGPFNILQNWTSNMSLGDANLYFTAGLNRGSFGPFFDNGVVLGPQASRAGHFSLVYRKPSFTFSTLLLEINATDTLGDGMYPNKHVMLHSIDFEPIKRLEIGFYESVIWGERFEFLYAIPLNQYFAAQSLAGFDDNSLIGFHGKWSPADGLQFLGDVYIDDFSFNDVVRFNFDTKYKLAAELGLRWTPERSLLSDVALDYTAVMPYMYTHIAADREDRYDATDPSVNYLNYTTMGACLGADLDPNSDRVSLRAILNIFPKLSVSLLGELIRHGNASEGIYVDGTDVYYDNHDGSINDDGYTDAAEPKATFQNTTRFLTQDVIETKLRGGLGFAFTIPTGFGSFGAGADYVVEYGWNRNLEDGNDGFAHYYAFTGTWRW